MRTALAILVVAMSVAGCGGGSEEKSTTTPGPAAETATAPEASAGEVTKSVDAGIKDFEYVPSQLTVASGGKVSWTNEDSANHTVTFSDKKLKSIGNLRNGQKQSITFDEAGEYTYVCAYHPNMRGTVVVK